MAGGILVEKNCLEATWNQLPILTKVTSIHTRLKNRSTKGSRDYSQHDDLAQSQRFIQERAGCYRS